MTLTVLHAIPSLVGGGAERQLGLVTREMSRRGVNTHVAYLRGGVNLSAIQSSSVHLHPLKPRNSHDPRILLELVNLIRKVQPDIVQTWLLQMDVLAGLAAMFSQTRFLLSERCSASSYEGSWKHKIRRQVGLCADAVVANSQSGADYWSDFARERYVIRNGLETKNIAQIPPASLEDVMLPKDAHLILFAGRFVKQKNIATLISALELVLLARPDTVAMIFGDGPLRAALQGQINSTAVPDRLRIESYSANLERWMRRASVFVTASLFEGHPNVVLEAASLECPLVVSEIPEHREFLDDSMSMFCDPNSSISIKNAICSVIDDPKATQKRLKAASLMANSYSIEFSVDEYLRIYEDLMSGSTGKKR